MVYILSCLLASYVWPGNNWLYWNFLCICLCVFLSLLRDRQTCLIHLLSLALNDNWNFYGKESAFRMGLDGGEVDMEKRWCAGNGSSWGRRNCDLNVSKCIAWKWNVFSIIITIIIVCLYASISATPSWHDQRTKPYEMLIVSMCSVCLTVLELHQMLSLVQTSHLCTF